MCEQTRVIVVIVSRDRCVPCVEQGVVKAHVTVHVG